MAKLQLQPNKFLIIQDNQTNPCASQCLYSIFPSGLLYHTFTVRKTSMESTKRWYKAIKSQVSTSNPTYIDSNETFDCWLFTFTWNKVFVTLATTALKVHLRETNTKIFSPLPTFHNLRLKADLTATWRITWAINCQMLIWTNVLPHTSHQSDVTGIKQEASPRKHLQKSEHKGKYHPDTYHGSDCECVSSLYVAGNTTKRLSSGCLT